MRTIIISAVLLLTVWLQIIYPTSLTPLTLVPDFALVAIWAVAMYYEPPGVALWWGLLGGLAIDLWQPDQFGTWMLAGVITAIITLLIHKKLLPRENFISTVVTGAVAVLIGLGLIYLSEMIRSGADLSTWFTALWRIFAIRWFFDLLLLIPIGLLFKKLLRSLRIYQSDSKPL